MYSSLRCTNKRFGVCKKKKIYLNNYRECPGNFLPYCNFLADMKNIHKVFPDYFSFQCVLDDKTRQNQSSCKNYISVKNTVDHELRNTGLQIDF